MSPTTASSSVASPTPPLTTIVQVATVLEADPGTWMAGLAGVDLLPPRTRLYTATEFLEARREHTTRSKPPRGQKLR